MKIREATIWLYFVIFVKFFAIFKHYSEKTAEWIFAKFGNWVLFINHYGLVKSNFENFEIWPFTPHLGPQNFEKIEFHFKNIFFEFEKTYMPNLSEIEHQLKAPWAFEVAIILRFSLFSNG